MKKRFAAVVLALFAVIGSHCADYDFNIFNGTMDFATMEQMDLDYQSSTRILNRFIFNSIGDVELWGWFKPADLIIWSYPSLSMAITHEEGHRSILTAKSIGSISQPVFNGHGAAYVKGVTDATLSNLRVTDKPSFIRMYTAGIESDYVNVRRDEEVSFMYGDEYRGLWPDLAIRVLSISNYYCIPALFYDKYDLDIDNFLFNYSVSSLSLTEEENELERDICGLDVFGAVHYLFNDSSDFKRYVQWSDFSKGEKDFLIDRVLMKSYINFVNPSLFGFSSFHIGEDVKLNGSMGYTMCPFGDFIDENVYFAYKDFNFVLYTREFENLNNWSMGFGLKFLDYKPVNWLKLSAEGHFWMQPENLDFYTDKMVPGGAGKVIVTFMLPEVEQKSIGFNLSLLFKGKGYLPEIESHDQLWRFTTGVTLRY